MCESLIDESLEELSGAQADLQILRFPSHENLVVSFQKTRERTYLLASYARQIALPSKWIVEELTLEKLDECFCLRDSKNNISIVFENGRFIADATWREWSIANLDSQMTGTELDESDILNQMLERFSTSLQWERSKHWNQSQRIVIGETWYSHPENTLFGTVAAFSQKENREFKVNSIPTICYGIVAFEQLVRISTLGKWYPINGFTFSKLGENFVCNSSNRWQLVCNNICFLDEREFNLRIRRICEH